MIKDNLLKIKERVRMSCLAAKAHPDYVTIVAVTKGRDVEQIKEH